MSPSYDPHLEYTTRLEARRRSVQRYEGMYRRVALARLLSALLFIVLTWLSFFRGALSGLWLLVPSAAFLVLVVIHERLDERKRRAVKAVEFYEDGLARIEDRWIGRGQSTESSIDESHLYAADLDIFGEASLFELLCTARTRSGEKTLASWLMAPADPTEIVARQAAVEELRHRLDLREDLATLASNIRSSIDPDRMTAWGESPSVLRGHWQRIVAPFLAAGVFAAVAAAWFWDTNNAWLFLYGILVVEGMFGLFYRKRVRRVLAAAEEHEHDMELFSEILVRLEQEEFSSPKLLEIQSSLVTAGLSPSRQIAHFSRLSGLHAVRRVELVVVLALLFVFQRMLILPFSYSMWSTQFAFAIEAWRTRCGISIGQWLSTVGEFEALCAVAGYAYEHPADPFPELVGPEPLFEGEGLAHPLITRGQSVANTVRLGREPQLLVVSGSNMSGKSTLLRTVGINAVLALAGAPVRAERLRLSPLAIGATIRIQDSLQSGTSRFYTEIQRIRRITDLSREALPVLFLLDELLHGTNSHDRAIGAEAIVSSLIRRGAIGLATTHDLALAKVADGLGSRAANVHFEDQLEDGKIVFDYEMRPGVVEHSNALGLMRAVGLDV